MQMPVTTPPAPFCPEEAGPAGVLPESGVDIEPIPLSFAQQRLWFLDQLEPNNPVYNVPVAVRLFGKLNVKALERALNVVIVRHEALRTNVVALEGSPVQVIRDGRQIELEETDSSARPEELMKQIGQEARRVFNLETDLLLRATLFRLADQEHVFLLTLHHIICDEWSLAVLFKELAAAYGAFLHGQEPSLPELPIQYADYALWQHQWLQGPVLEEQLRYWKERLRNGVPRLELPVRSSQHQTDLRAGGQVSCHLPAALTEGLRQLSRQQGATLFVTLLASFKVLLARYTRQNDIAIGSPVAGRTRLETENLIGFFVNTLVLQTDLSGDPSFLDALGRVRQTALDAYDHQELPFATLVEALHPDRSEGDMPLVQVMFSLEHRLDQQLRLPGLELALLPVGTGTAKFDLTWAVRETEDTLEVCVEFAAGRFESETLSRMLTHWQVLLEGIVAQPASAISRLPLLTPTERERALVGWNQTDRLYPRAQSPASLFAAQAKLRPNALAVQYGSNQLSYSELNQRADRLACLLQEHGVGPEVLVAICAEPSVELVVAMLGILKAGGAYVPLDPCHPKERLRFILEEARPPVILTQNRLRPNLPPSAGAVIALDSVPSGNEAEPKPLSNPDALACIIYTSGSTGGPKGVQVPARGITRLVCNTDYAQLTSQDRVAQVSNVAFDAATFEIWGALLNGAALIGISRDLALAPKELAAELVREKITTLFLTTALFNQVAAEAPGAFRGLTHLLFGGETADPKWVREVLQYQPPQRLLHVYGPTETTTFASWHLVTDVAAEATSIPIGQPIANTRIYLLDDQLEPVAVGVAGQVFIGGDGVAQGYLRNPELSRQRFVPDPFTGQPGARLYRTGDLARYRADGAIDFIGRIDQQVKIRGFRVELGEIENALNSHKAVRECVVVALEGESLGGKRLAAYVVLKEGSAPSALAEVRESLKETLPSYMVPSHWLQMAALPLTGNGKVDRKRLPAPGHGRATLPEALVSPRNRTEEQLVKIWSSVLGVQRVGVQDNFFDLGGHSLLAVRLFARIEQEFGQKLPLATLFREPTIEKLAQRLQHEASAPWPLLVEIQPQGSKPAFFWVHSLGGDGGGAFFYYRKLAQLLGPDQPSMGIRSPQEPFTRIEEMAARYIDALLQFQAQGPYFLGGFCFGGIVAFEMARQLTILGKEVGLVALLESASPGKRRSKLRWRPGSAAFLASNFQYWIRDMRHRGPAELYGRIHRRMKSVQRKMVRLVRRADERAPTAALSELIDMTEYPKDYVRYAQAHWQALLNYEPQPFSGRITLFRARKQPLLNLDPTLGWADLASDGVTVNVIPGTHEKMLEEPNVQILANELKACLVEAQAIESDPPDSPSSTGTDLASPVVTSCSCSIIT